MIAKSSAGMTSEPSEINDWKRFSFSRMGDIMDLMSPALSSRFRFLLSGDNVHGPACSV